MRHKKALEIESILFAMFAAVPLYATGAVEPSAVALFHLVMSGIALGTRLGRRRIQVPVQVLGIIGVVYLLFFPLDVLVISRSLIRSSAHLLFFIGVYQVLESTWRDNGGQRVLVTFLIFVTSVATSTHLSIVFFVLGFAFFIFRQLMHLSFQKTMSQTACEYPEAATSRGAASYVIPTVALAAALFPLLPRLHNPMIGGNLTSPLDRRTTGISDTIDLGEERTVSTDPAVVARVWMDAQTSLFFSPVRLRASAYDEYWGGEWRRSSARRRGIEQPARVGETFLIADGDGPAGHARVQQRTTSDYRLYLPAGTKSISGLRFVFQRDDELITPDLQQGPVTYDVEMSRTLFASAGERPDHPNYPLTPEIIGLAREAAAGATTPVEAAMRLESFFVRNFEYVANVNDQGRPITIEDFLLRERRGHCEYFAAGMVVLLTGLDIPSRIVGGFYGGQINPFTGYIVMRRSDAHAWVEVFDGTRWVTFDPTPPSLRPGTSAEGWLRSYVDAMSESLTYYWDRYVLTFGLRDQIAIALDLIDRSRATFAGARRTARALVRQAPAILVVSGVAIGLSLIGYLWWKIPRPHGTFEHLAHRLRALGIEVDESMSAGELLAYLRRERPDLVPLVAPILNTYQVERFAPYRPTEEMVAAATNAMARLREAE